MIVRNKISITFPLPLSYVDKVSHFDGVAAVSHWTWFGGLYIDERNFFANFAADDGFLSLYPEMVVSDEEKKAWAEDRSGCVVGEHLLEKYDWKVGQKVTLKGTIYPGDWDFTIRGVYKATAKSVDPSMFFFHWGYLNDRLDERRKDKVGLLVIKVPDAGHSADISRDIDKKFVNSIAETRTESEKAFQLEFVSMSSQILAAIQIVSIVVLVILILILGNTLAMATRERTTEYAVMRAIGFRPWHVVRLVLGEGFVVASLGAAIGVGLAQPIMKVFAQALEKRMGGFLAGLELSPRMALISVGVAILCGMLASALPAWRSGRIKIVDALRRVE
jgi:putative ABC transport system permease protein